MTKSYTREEIVTREEIKVMARRVVSSYEEAKKMFPALFPAMFAVAGVSPVDPITDAMEVCKDYLRLSEPPKWIGCPDSDGLWWVVMADGEVDVVQIDLGSPKDEQMLPWGHEEYVPIGSKYYTGPWLKAEVPTPPKKET